MVNPYNHTYWYIKPSPNSIEKHEVWVKIRRGKVGLTSSVHISNNVQRLIAIDPKWNGSFFPKKCIQQAA